MQYSYIEEFDAAMRAVATLEIEQTYNDQSLEEMGAIADDAAAVIPAAVQNPVIGIPARQPARIPFCVCRDKWHTTATGT